jgi:hypothetical protein
VDRVTGQLANEFTPADRVEEHDVMVFPSQYREWAAAHGYPVLMLEPPQYAFPPELALVEPINDSAVGARVLVTGRVKLPSPLVWRLEYGVGPAPIGWGVLIESRTGDLDGFIGEWDAGATAAQHGAGDFTLRLAAYDPANMDYPVAVSGPVHVYVSAPAPTPEPSASPTPEPSPTETPPAATPTLEATPTPTPTLTPAPTVTPETPTPVPTPPAAGALIAIILSPADGAQVSGQVEIAGIAEGAGFAGYELLFAPGATPGDSDWLPAGNPGLQPVSGGVLGVWDTSGLAPGLYSLRLHAYDAGGNAAASMTRVEVVE